MHVAKGTQLKSFETVRGSLSRRSAQQCSKSRQAGAQQMHPRTTRRRGAHTVLLEMDSLGLRYSGSGDIGCWFVDFRGPKYRGS